MKRVWKYTVGLIAEAIGASPRTVRRDRKRGVLLPDSIVSVAEYIVAKRLDKEPEHEAE